MKHPLTRNFRKSSDRHDGTGRADRAVPSGHTSPRFVSLRAIQKYDMDHFPAHYLRSI